MKIKEYIIFINFFKFQMNAGKINQFSNPRIVSAILLDFLTLITSIVKLVLIIALNVIIKIHVKNVIQSI